jgi:phosphonate transport system substrate-binding protein
MKSARPPLSAWLACVTGLLLAGLASSAAAAELTLALVPQSPAAVMHRQWAPFVERLGREAGVTIRLRVYRGFAEFEAELQRGLPDLVYLNPYQQLRAHKSQGYRPLVRNGARALTGVLVVRHDSPARALRDLDGAHIAFPDPNAFAASLYMRALLQEQGKIRFHAHYLSTHANVYRHVILGRMAAGGGVNLTLERESPETRQALRVLYETPPVVPHPLSAHPRLPTALQETLTRAALRLHEDEAGRALLQRVDLAEPVRADQARDYQPLEQLRLDRYTSTTGAPGP